MHAVKICAACHNQPILPRQLVQSGLVLRGVARVVNLHPVNGPLCGKLGRKLHAAVHAGMRQHHHAACAARQFQHGLHGLVGRVVQHAPAARAEQLAVQLFINPVCVSIFKQQADEVCFVGDAAAPGKRLCLFPAELRV